MRVNVYDEEIVPERVELVRKGEFSGIRFYLELPVALSTPPAKLGEQPGVAHLQGPFVHRPGDDDSAAVTFWGKRKFKAAMIRALRLLEVNEPPANDAIGRAGAGLYGEGHRTPTRQHVKGVIFNAMRSESGGIYTGSAEEIEKAIDSLFG